MHEESEDVGLFELLIQSLDGYQAVVDGLIQHTDPDGVSRVSQHELARQLGVSQGLISRRLGTLEETDQCVVMISPGAYRVQRRDLTRHGPVARTMRYVLGVLEHGEIMWWPYEQQAAYLGLEVVDVQRAHGYMDNAMAMERWTEKQRRHRADIEER